MSLELIRHRVEENFIKMQSVIESAVSIKIKIINLPERTKIKSPVDDENRRTYSQKLREKVRQLSENYFREIADGLNLSNLRIRRDKTPYSLYGCLHHPSFYAFQYIDQMFSELRISPSKRNHLISINDQFPTDEMLPMMADSCRSTINHFNIDREIKKNNPSQSGSKFTYIEGFVALDRINNTAKIIFKNMGDDDIQVLNVQFHPKKSRYELTRIAPGSNNLVGSLQIAQYFIDYLFRINLSIIQHRYKDKRTETKYDRFKYMQCTISDTLGLIPSRDMLTRLDNSLLIVESYLDEDNNLFYVCD